MCRFAKCISADAAFEGGTPFTSCLHCRSFTLMQSDSCFLRLAPSALHTLVFELRAGTGDDVTDLDRLSSLTDLKRLELIGVSFADRDHINTTLGRQIEVLVLIECSEAEVHLLTPQGALPKLKALHVEENQTEALIPIQMARVTRDYMTKYIRAIDSILYSDSVRWISGNSKCLVHCMKNSPCRWDKSYVSGPEVSENSKFYEGQQFRAWTKPADAPQ